MILFLFIYKFFCWVHKKQFDIESQQVILFLFCYSCVNKLLKALYSTDCCMFSCKENQQGIVNGIYDELRALFKLLNCFEVKYYGGEVGFQLLSCIEVGKCSFYEFEDGDGDGMMHGKKMCLLVDLRCVLF